MTLKSLQAALTSLNVSWPDLVIYTAIAAVTLVGLFKCLIPLWRSTATLHRAEKRLQDHAGIANGEKPIWQESRFMGKCLRGAWLRFLQNAEQLDRRGLPCNVEDYINDDTVTYGPGNATLAELIPSLLTSLGILGTFIGLMRGLTGLNMTDSVSLMNGIPILLDGMKTAFATSVAGVSCSLIFNMVNRMAQGRSFRAIDSFVTSFTQLAMQRPLDNDVQLICQNQDANNMLYSVTDSITTQVASSIEQAVGRAMQPVSASLDRFLMASTRQQVEGVALIVNNFVDRMNDSLSRQLLALGQTMTDVNRHQQATMAAVETSLKTASAISQNAEQLHNLHSEIMAQYARFSREMTAAREHDEQFTRQSGKLLQQMQEASDLQAGALVTIRTSQDQLLNVMNDFRRASQSSLEGIHQAEAAAAGRLEEAGRGLNAAGDKLARSYQGFVAEMVNGTEKSLSAFTESMKAVVSDLDKQTSSLSKNDSADLVASLGELQRLCASMETTLKQIADAD